MPKRILLILTALAAALCASAQQKVQVDSAYVCGFGERFSVRAFLAKEFLVLEHDSPQGERSFMPNTSPRIGLGLSVSNTIIDFSFGHGLGFMRDREKGKTDAFDMQIHHYGRRFVVDAFIQRYKGFYLDEPQLELCPDLRVAQYGLRGDYVFNSRRFSFRAAYNRSERQMISAGTFLAGVGAYVTDIKSDSSLVIGDRRSFRTFQMGIHGGYAHTWAFPRNWFINLSCTVGINLGEGVNSSGRTEFGVFPSALPRLAVGYNAYDWSLGFSFVGNLTAPSISDESSLTLFSCGLRLSFIKRFGMPKRTKSRDGECAVDRK